MNEEWLPFKLVAFPESMGDPRYTLMFTDFKKLETVASLYAAENELASGKPHSFALLPPP